jgi:hypothetical protein
MPRPHGVARAQRAREGQAVSPRSSMRRVPPITARPEPGQLLGVACRKGGSCGVVSEFVAPSALVFWRTSDGSARRAGHPRKPRWCPMRTRHQSLRIRTPRVRRAPLLTRRIAHGVSGANRGWTNCCHRAFHDTSTRGDDRLDMHVLPHQYHTSHPLWRQRESLKDAVSGGRSRGHRVRGKLGPRARATQLVERCLVLHSGAG